MQAFSRNGGPDKGRKRVASASLSFYVCGRPEEEDILTFIPDFSTIVQFAVATFIIAITPGPDMTLFVGRALSQGRSAGLACMAGAMCGCVIHTSLVALGLSALIVASPAAFLALKVVGAGYLVWLAFNAIRHGSAFKPEKMADGPSHSLLRNWATGLGINLLNPKIILFFMTFLPQFVSAHDPHAPGKLLFLGLLVIPLSLPITTPMVLVADGVASLLKKSPRVTRLTDYLFAGVFSAFALKILSAHAR
jgi:threonine/homoserine/homoserine lactone efflux protein